MSRSGRWFPFWEGKEGTNKMSVDEFVDILRDSDPFFNKQIRSRRLC